MPFRAAVVDQMLDRLHAADRSALELKLYAFKEQHMNLILASRRCIRRDRHRQAQEVALFSLAAPLKQRRRK
jgi:hypothetical protein